MRIGQSICRTALIGAALGTALGCAAQRHGLSAAAPPAAPPSAAASGTLDQLARLREQRGEAQTRSDYVIGEGDLLAVRAFGLDELNGKARVDGSGTIRLPLLDTVPVAGRTVSQVQQDLTQRLGQFMYQPHVDVFVEEYRSQQIAVVGAVQRPGLVSETGKGMTVLDAISAAGGMTPEAAGRIYLIPVESRTPKTTQAVALAMRPDTTNGTEHILRDATPITVNMEEVGQDAQAMFFTLPVHGGDVLVVPARGKFLVQGWVKSPGTYPVTSSLTLRGALASAGGLEFPAQTRHVRVYRPTSNGTSELLDVNYNAVAARKTPDVFIHDGDVVEVGASYVKMVPYGVYRVVMDVFRVGAKVGVGF